MTLPAVISADLRLNEPRFATLQNIMKARKKQIEEIAVAEMGVDVESMLEYLEVREPPVRKGGVLVDSVEELFEMMSVWPGSSARTTRWRCVCRRAWSARAARWRRLSWSARRESGRGPCGSDTMCVFQECSRNCEM